MWLDVTSTTKGKTRGEYAFKLSKGYVTTFQLIITAKNHEIVLPENKQQWMQPFLYIFVVANPIENVMEIFFHHL